MNKNVPNLVRNMSGSQNISLYKVVEQNFVFTICNNVNLNA